MPSKSKRKKREEAYERQLSYDLQVLAEWNAWKLKRSIDACGGNMELALAVFINFYDYSKSQYQKILEIEAVRKG